MVLEIMKKNSYLRKTAIHFFKMEKKLKQMVGDGAKLVN